MTTLLAVYVFSWGAGVGVVIGAVIVWHAVRVGWVQP